MVQQLNERFNDATGGSTGWMNLTCLIRPTGWTNRLDDRSHDATVGPTVGPTGWTDRLVQQLDRVNAALLLCYKIIHGLVALNFDEFLFFSPNTTLRGHPYKLTVPLNKCNRSKYFFSSRIVPIWNNLPVAVVMSKNAFLFRMSVRKIDLSRYLIVPPISC